MFSNLLGAGLLSAAYAIRLQLLAFGPRTAGEVEGTAAAARNAHAHRPPPAELAALATLAVGSVALGVLWWPQSAQVVEQLVGAGVQDGNTAELMASVSMVSVGAAWAWTRTRPGRAGAMVPAAVTKAAGGWFGLTTASRRGIAEPLLALASGLARFDETVVDAPTRWASRAVAGATHALPRFDDAVIDGAVRRVAAAGRLASRALAWWLERGVDSVVAAVAAATAWAGHVSRIGDDAWVDAAVERLSSAVGVAGRRSRGLQSGLAHHYYVLAVIGLVVLLAAAAIGR